MTKDNPRRTVGCVRFPVDDKRYEDTGEGGISVWLLVLPRTADYLRRWGKCAGPHALLFENQRFIGTDKEENTEKIVGGEQTFPLHKSLFPHHASSDPQCWVSAPLLAAVCLGTTTWSGRSCKTGKMWRCKEKDLTPNGWTIYDSLRTLYGDKAHVGLTTWLDT